MSFGQWCNIAAVAFVAGFWAFLEVNNRGRKYPANLTYIRILYPLLILINLYLLARP